MLLKISTRLSTKTLSSQSYARDVEQVAMVVFFFLFFLFKYIF